MATALSLACVYACIGVLQSRQIDRLDQLMRRGNYTPVFSYLQLQVEYLRLHHTLYQYQYDPRGLPLEDVRLRYDLFVSRLSIIETGSTAALLTRDPSYAAAVQALHVFTDRADRLLTQRPDRAGVPLLHADLVRLREPIQDLTNAAVRAASRNVDAGNLEMQSQARLTALLTGVQGALTLVLGYVIVRLYEYRKQAQAAALASQGRLLELLRRNEAELEAKVAERTVRLEEAMSEIKKLAITDALTGCFNRRHLQDQLPVEITRARRQRRPLAVVLFDIDNFKRVNDTLGHPGGDEVLRMVTSRCRDWLRGDIDWIARLGGEEFAIVLPEASLAMALQITEGLRASIEKERITYADKTTSVTCSFGVAALSADDSADAVLLRGDRLLYSAKAQGRNCVVGDR